MKNANIFVDVDLTLVDASGNLIPGARDALQSLKDSGCHLFLWSTVGMAYAQTTATRHKLTDLFEDYSAKPDIVIDDLPATVLNPFVFNPLEEVSWGDLAARILKKHID
jgi:phosphoglycolate phosphatase-like HAD superfamily hydrolase